MNRKHLTGQRYAPYQNTPVDIEKRRPAALAQRFLVRRLLGGGPNSMYVPQDYRGALARWKLSKLMAVFIALALTGWSGKALARTNDSLDVLVNAISGVELLDNGSIELSIKKGAWTTRLPGEHHIVLRWRVADDAKIRIVGRYDRAGWHSGAVMFVDDNIHLHLSDNRVSATLSGLPKRFDFDDVFELARAPDFKKDNGAALEAKLADRLWKFLRPNPVNLILKGEPFPGARMALRWDAPPVGSRGADKWVKPRREGLVSSASVKAAAVSFRANSLLFDRTSRNASGARLQLGPTLSGRLDEFRWSEKGSPRVSLTQVSGQLSASRFSAPGVMFSVEEAVVEGGSLVLNGSGVTFDAASLTSSRLTSETKFVWKRTAPVSELMVSSAAPAGTATLKNLHYSLDETSATLSFDEGSSFEFPVRQGTLPLATKTSALLWGGRAGWRGSGRWMPKGSHVAGSLTLREVNLDRGMLLLGADCALPFASGNVSTTLSVDDLQRGSLHGVIDRLQVDIMEAPACAVEPLKIEPGFFGSLSVGGEGRSASFLDGVLTGLATLHAHDMSLKLGTMELQRAEFDAQLELGAPVRASALYLVARVRRAAELDSPVQLTLSEGTMENRAWKAAGQLSIPIYSGTRERRALSYQGLEWEASAAKEEAPLSRLSGDSRAVNGQLASSLQVELTARAPKAASTDPCTRDLAENLSGSWTVKYEFSLATQTLSVTEVTPPRQEFPQSCSGSALEVLKKAIQEPCRKYGISSTLCEANRTPTASAMALVWLADAWSKR